MKANMKQWYEIHAKTTGCTKSQAESEIKNVIHSLTETLKEHGGVQATGHFSLEAVTKPARIGRNPSTGEEIKIPEKKAIKFSAGNLLKKAINN